MIREDLAAIPQYALPAGYRMRRFGAGDRATWVRIEQVSDPDWPITGETFDDEFGRDLPAMAKRGYFLVSPGGEDVGTITAWYDRRYRRRRWGRIHWVAIVPAHRGLGLSRSAMTVAMNRLRALGHRRAMLATQTHRTAAIRTYLRFGFVPDLTDAGAAEAWRLVGEQIDLPALKGL
jgi:GNAT superfamily N-acetyltransferase